VCSVHQVEQSSGRRLVLFCFSAMGLETYPRARSSQQCNQSRASTRIFSAYIIFSSLKISIIFKPPASYQPQQQAAADTASSSNTRLSSVVYVSPSPLTYARHTSHRAHILIYANTKLATSARLPLLAAAMYTPGP